MNIIMLVGRLVRNPSYSEIENEKGQYHIASFFLAVPKNYGNGVNYLKVTAFGKQAEFARDYLKKGMRVAVSGELMTGSYKDKDTDRTVYTTEVTASRLEFADGKRSSDTSNENPAGYPETDAEDFSSISEELNKELPFR